jgi:hypothetical protein
VGRELNSGETERERGRETECCSKRVTASAINLTVGQIFMATREQIILGIIKINIKTIPKNLDCIVFLFSRHSDFSSPCQTADMSHFDKKFLPLSEEPCCRGRSTGPERIRLTPEYPKGERIVSMIILKLGTRRNVRI